MHRTVKLTLLLFVVANVFFGSIAATDNLPDKKEVREREEDPRSERFAISGRSSLPLPGNNTLHAWS
jgi:hypothetical protein